jgi:hypothetical protein
LGGNIYDLVEKINIEFQKITLYFRKYKLSLHPDKTKFLLFSSSGATHTQQTNMELFINNNPHNFDLVDLNLILSMERITSDSKFPAMKFLEVCFDQSLNFKFQVAKITSKLAKALYIMRMVKTISIVKHSKCFITPSFTVI